MNKIKKKYKDFSVLIEAINDIKICYKLLKPPHMSIKKDPSTKVMDGKNMIALCCPNCESEEFYKFGKYAICTKCNQIVI